MESPEESKKEQKTTSLEMANEMFKMAFLVKKQKFSEQFPNFSESELDQKTAEYFIKLSKD